MKITEKNEIQIEKFPYYTGDRATGFDPSEGRWDGNRFFTPEGQVWYLPDDIPDNDLFDGQGIVWLFSAPNRGE
jgi:hypothetical protein